MKSGATTIPTYLEEPPEDRRATLHEMIRRVVPDVDETMRYGMPTYERDGRVLFALASQKHHLAFYVCDNINRIDAVRGELIRGTGVSIGKGCIRFKRIDRLPMETIEQLMRDVVE